MKPGGKSKGIGISVLDNLSDIIELNMKNDENYVIQKYIENPLLYEKRKFDMRIWIVLISTQPYCA